MQGALQSIGTSPFSQSEPESREDERPALLCRFRADKHLGFRDTHPGHFPTASSSNSFKSSDSLQYNQEM